MSAIDERGELLARLHELEATCGRLLCTLRDVVEWWDAEPPYRGLSAATLRNARAVVQGIPYAAEPNDHNPKLHDRIRDLEAELANALGAMRKDEGTGSGS